MAPRVRSKKRGNLRIDAALDAMNPFGFPPKLVRHTVKELLSVYGGDDGWVFIEEGSYTLLIDTLLEKQKDGAIEKVPEENVGADRQATLVAGCSSSVIDEASSSNPGAEITVMGNGTLRITSALPANDSEERYGKDDDDRVGSTLNQSSPARIPKPSRRRPYHGWISNDDKVDLVHLTPAPLPEELAKLFILPAQRKRKQRWDAKSADS